jgi:hypothetical protein
MCSFDYGNVHKNIYIYNHYKTKSLGACEKLLYECSPYKDQVLNTWMILVEQYVSFNSCSLQVFCMVHVDVV